MALLELDDRIVERHARQVGEVRRLRLEPGYLLGVGFCFGLTLPSLEARLLERDLFGDNLVAKLRREVLDQAGV